MATKLFNERRAEALKRQANAAKKIARIESQGIKIKGSEFDPLKDISKMNARQLKSYSDQLAGFTDRKNQFVGTRRGQPVPVSEWRAYKRAETAYNKANAKAYEKAKNLALPNSQLTVDQFQQLINPVQPGRGYASVMTPYKSTQRDVKNIESRSAVRQLTEQMKNRMTDEYRSAASQRARNLAIEGIKNLHNPELLKRIQLMPERQFKRLSLYTNFMEDVKLVKYPHSAIDDEMLEAEADKISSYISWGENSDDAIREASRANVALTKSEAAQVRRGTR